MNYRMSDFAMCVPNFSLANTKYGMKVLSSLGKYKEVLSCESILKAELVVSGLCLPNLVCNDADEDNSAMILF